MLQIVKTLIHEQYQSKLSFPELYVRYMCSVQDIDIQNECNSIHRNSLTTVNSLLSLVDNELLKGDAHI